MSAAWNPTQVTAVTEGPIGTSTRPLRVVTDAGAAILKYTSNPEGPHVLVGEWVGHHAARALGLTTFDFSLVAVDAALASLASAAGAMLAAPSTGFAIRYDELGAEWDGGRESLANLTDPSAITRLVWLDTWLRNPDRFHVGPPPRRNADNVWLRAVDERGRKRDLVAFDFSHAIRCGRSEIGSPQLSISAQHDSAVYGTFPEFESRVVATVLPELAERALAWCGDGRLDTVLAEIPRDWEFAADKRAALRNFLEQRARFLLRCPPAVGAQGVLVPR